MLTLSQLRDIFKRYDFRPLKRFGENYLIDGNIKGKLIKEAGISRDDTVLEIGPGLGALTIDIAETGARTFAVEKDPKAFAILKDIVGDSFPNLTIINSDILKFDIESIFVGKKIKVIGNLPYYITAPIIEYLIENRKFLEYGLVMVQKEVAERLAALPGSKSYGSLSCFVQYYTEPVYVHTVRHGSFYPAPEVDSSILKLNMRKLPAVKVEDEKLLFTLIRGAFNQRRKSIINSISRKEVMDIPKEALARSLRDSGIDLSSRPESLSLSDFAAISNLLSGQG